MVSLPPIPTIPTVPTISTEPTVTPGAWGNHMPEPESLKLLSSLSPELISPEYFRQCLYDFGNWCVATGVNPDTLQHPDLYFKGNDDLEAFLNVVNKWPNKAPQTCVKPTLIMLLKSLRVYPPNRPLTFSEELERYWANVERWMVDNKINPDNPDETPEERRRRKQREATARFRAKQRAQNVSDTSTFAKLEKRQHELRGLLKKARAVADSRKTEARMELDFAVRQLRKEFNAKVALIEKDQLDIKSQLEEIDAQMDLLISNK